MTTTYNQKYYVGDTHLYITRATTLDIGDNNVNVGHTGRWDGSTLESFGNSGMNTLGLCIYDTGTNTYVGGTFTTVSGLSIPYIAKWDGTEWSDMSAMGNGIGSNVQQLAYDASNGYMYCAGYQSATTVNKVIKYTETTNTWEGIATSFDVTNYPKMTVDSSSQLWLGYGNTIKRYDPVISSWNDISNASPIIYDMKHHNGRIYFAAGNGISYVSTNTTGPHINLPTIQGVAGVKGVDILIDGSVVACFQVPMTGDASGLVQLYDGNSWNSIYRTTNNLGNIGIWADANSNLFVACNTFLDTVGVPPYGDANWRNLSDSSMNAVTFGGSVAAALRLPSITISGGTSQVLLKDAPASLTLSATNTPTSWTISPSLSAINLTMNGSTGEITGTPLSDDIAGTLYTVTATNNYGNGTANLTLAVRDSYTIDMIDSASYSVVQTVSAGSLTPVNESTLFTDISAYIVQGDNRLRRRTLLNYVLSRAANSGYTYITSNRNSLKLPSTYTKDKIRVYRPNSVIDLNDLSGDEGAYVTIGKTGETCTFLNVGGNGNIITFTANGDNTYDITGNGVDLGSTSDGEEVILFGVAFYIGSVGTEGTAGDAICFTGDAMVRMAYGEKRIDTIIPGDIILDGNNSHHVVKDAIRVVNTAQSLIYIPKDGLSPNYPTRDTVMTPEHQIYYQNRWTKARDIVHPCIKVIKPVPYQYVYHLTLAEQGQMIVNGLLAETLSPDNVNAQTRKHVLLRSR